MAGHASLNASNNVGKLTVDAMDAQILAFQVANPDASLRDIGNAVGLSHVAVHFRLRRIKQSDPIQDAIRRIGALTPLAVHVYEDFLTGVVGTDAERLSAARDVLRGRGVLAEKSEITNRNAPVNDDDFLDYLDTISADRLDAIISKHAARIVARGTAGDGQSDSAVVVGDGTASDASESAA